LPFKPLTASQKTDYSAIRYAVEAVKPFWEKSEIQ